MSAVATGALAGRMAVVTGAASGIGRATAAALAGHGATVIRVDKDPCPEPGSLAGDLSRQEEIRTCADRIGAAHGRVDILVNCAGIVGPRVRLADLTEDDWDAVHTVNLKAAVFLTKALLPYVPDGGRIVNVSSASAHRAHAYSLAYATSKAALECATRVLAGELAERHINVNAVAPGVTATAIHGTDSDADRTRRAREGATANLFGRFSQPEDIAGAIVYLCLPESRQITAQTIHVSAGAIV